jgi:farnesyl-diphosphate farnesyltransferase
MSEQSNATDVLKETSRTFYLSIVGLPPDLKEAVMSAYLSLRAIDEIEDHPQLDSLTKVKLLSAIGHEFERNGKSRANDFSRVCGQYRDCLPEVTNRLDEWSNLAPTAIAPRIRAANGEMAKAMSYWAARDWKMSTQADLDRYTFSVAGSVGVLLSDLWMWYDGTKTNRNNAIGFGRGLQAVNILCNRSEDLARGVDFFPAGWTVHDLRLYAQQNLSLAHAYVETLALGPAREFCQIPLTLAYGTLGALARGQAKLSRESVLELVTEDRSPNQQGCNGPVRERVILVNEDDEVVGFEGKMEAHLLGALHRAFSIFIFNSAGDLLLQKRSSTKYHSQGLWSNTCCGHPRFGESTAQASRRRLSEEMGFDCELREMFEFVYRAELDDGLTEHEYDHVLVGNFDGTPNPSSNEVDDWKWIDLPTLKRDLQENPEEHTYWFRIALEMLIESMKSVEFSYIPRAASFET